MDPDLWRPAKSEGGPDRLGRAHPLQRDAQLCPARHGERPGLPGATRQDRAADRIRFAAGRGAVSLGSVVALGADDHSTEGAPPEALRRALAAIEAAGFPVMARSRIVIADASPARPQPWYATLAAALPEGSASETLRQLLE